jgi:hypothetical protein
MRSDLFVTLLLILFFSASVHAQIEASYANPDPITENRYIGIKGSAYLFENWLPGKIYEFEGDVFQHTKINYNTKTGKVEIQNENGSITVINEVLYHQVEIMDKDQTLTFANRLTKGDINYYQVIYKGDQLAFLEKTVAEVKTESSSEYSAYKYTGVFSKQNQHYILKDGQIQEVFRNKKKILEFFNSKELEQFVKKEKIKFNRDEDLAKAFRFLEEGLN